MCKGMCIHHMFRDKALLYRRRIDFDKKRKQHVLEKNISKLITYVLCYILCLKLKKKKKKKNKEYIIISSDIYSCDRS